MKLDSVNVVMIDRRHKFGAVGRYGQHVLGSVANRPVLMHIVEALFLALANERVGRGRAGDRPTHMWQLQAPVVAEVELDHVRIDPPEARFPPFLAPTAEQLHAEADPKDRNLVLERDPMENIDPAAVRQRPHSRIECADARQDQPTATVHPGRVGHDFGRAVDRFEHTLDRSDIADPAIDNRRVERRMPALTRVRSLFQRGAAHDNLLSCFLEKEADDHPLPLGAHRMGPVRRVADNRPCSARIGNARLFAA